MRKIFVGGDHAGFTLKKAIKEYLYGLGYLVVDIGTDKNESCHYPDFAVYMSKVIQPDNRGILICGSGIGICIAANKSGLKCGTAFNSYTARECGRLFQVMAMGYRIVSKYVMKGIVDEFLAEWKY